MTETPMEAIDRRAREGRVPILLGDLMGPAGNAFAVMAAVKDALRSWDQVTGDTQLERFDAILADMTSGDYDHLLEVVDREFMVHDVHRGKAAPYHEWLVDYRAQIAANQRRAEEDE